MGVTDGFEAGVAQFFGIAPVQAVGQGVADDGKVLMAVGSDEWAGVGFAVEPESLGALEFNAAYADAAAVTVEGVAAAG